MPLHQSLADLSELAVHCQSPATARGLLAEAQDLLRNSLDHRADELELAAWFSRVITDIVRSLAFPAQSAYLARLLAVTHCPRWLSLG